MFGVVAALLRLNLKDHEGGGVSREVGAITYRGGGSYNSEMAAPSETYPARC